MFLKDDLYAQQGCFCWETVELLNIFVETVIIILFSRIFRWIESLKEQQLFEIEIFCNIINVFTITFDKWNTSLLKKKQNKKTYWPQTFELVV